MYTYEISEKINARDVEKMLVRMLEDIFPIIIIIIIIMIMIIIIIIIIIISSSRASSFFAHIFRARG